MKILIIDNLHDQLPEFKAALIKNNFALKVANSGIEGLETVKDYCPDLILLGEMLPQMTGNEVLRQLKSQEATKEIPVVILSHFKSEALISEAMDLGAIDYIVKNTLSGTDLVEKVTKIIQEQHGGTGWQSGDASAL